jgi:ABC-type transport system substrate-binding protein
MIDIADIHAAIFDVIDKKKWLDGGKIEPVIPGVSVPGQNPWLTIYFAKMNLKVKNPDGTLNAFQPFQDVRVRKAFASAIDTADIRRNVFNGFAEPTSWGLTPAQFGYDAAVKAAYSFNLEQAKKLFRSRKKTWAARQALDLVSSTTHAPGGTSRRRSRKHQNLNVSRWTSALSFTEYVNSWRSQLTSFSIHSTFS